ncbi:MAG: hypothetical protein ABIW16_00030 [Sphingomicrobium sp.]
MLAAAAGAGAPPPELPTGSRLGSHLRPGPKLTLRDQAVGAKRMAQCLYNLEPELARATLLAPTRSYAEATSAKLSGRLQCMGAEFANDMVEERYVNFPHEILRGMLAEVALQRSRGEVDALQPLPLQPVYARPWFAVTGRHLSVDEMGACLADTNPAAAATLIRTPPAGSEEGAAFASLADNLGKCLRAGTRLQASRQALRAALAEALYQRINVPLPASAPTAEATKN